MGVRIEPVGTGSSAVLGLPCTNLWEPQHSTSTKVQQPTPTQSQRDFREWGGTHVVLSTGHTLKDTVEGVIVPYRPSFSGTVSYFACLLINVCGLPPAKAR